MIRTLVLETKVVWEFSGPWKNVSGTFFTMVQRQVPLKSLIPIYRIFNGKSMNCLHYSNALNTNEGFLSEKDPSDGTLTHRTDILNKYVSPTTNGICRHTHHNKTSEVP